MGFPASNQGEYFKDPLIRQKTWRVSVWLKTQAERMMKSAQLLEKQISFPPKAHFEVSKLYKEGFHASDLVQNAVFLEMALFGRHSANNQIGLINTAVQKGLLLQGTSADGVFPY